MPTLKVATREKKEGIISGTKGRIALQIGAQSFFSSYRVIQKIMYLFNFKSLDIMVEIAAFRLKILFQPMRLHDWDMVLGCREFGI